MAYAINAGARIAKIFLCAAIVQHAMRNLEKPKIQTILLLSVVTQMAEHVYVFARSAAGGYEYHQHAAYAKSYRHAWYGNTGVSTIFV